MSRPETGPVSMTKIWCRLFWVRDSWTNRLPLFYLFYRQWNLRQRSIRRQGFHHSRDCTQSMTSSWFSRRYWPSVQYIITAAFLLQIDTLASGWQKTDQNQLTGFFVMAAPTFRQAHTLFIPFYSCRLAYSCINKCSLYFSRQLLHIHCCFPLSFHRS